MPVGTRATAWVAIFRAHANVIPSGNLGDLFFFWNGLRSGGTRALGGAYNMAPGRRRRRV